MENSPPRGLKRVEKWLYAKGLEERSSGCVLCGSCYGHGPANPMEDVSGPKEKCPPYELYRFQRHTPKSRWLMDGATGFSRARAVTPELKEVINACTNCLMCRELCGVLKTGRLKFSKRLKKRVVYHDACHLGRGTGVYEEPRNILRAIPGVQLLEMPCNRRWSWCGGGLRPVRS